MARSDGPSSNAVKLAEDFARLYLEASLIKVIFYLAHPPEIYRAARDLQSHLADGHAQRPRSWPGGKEGAAGKFAYHLEPGEWIGDIVPKSYSDDELETLRRLPIEHIAQHKPATVSHAFALHQLTRQVQHFGSKVHARHLGAALGQGVYKAP